MAASSSLYRIVSMPLVAIMMFGFSRTAATDPATTVLTDAGQGAANITELALGDASRLTRDIVRDNYIYFHGADSIEYQEDWHEITYGQSFMHAGPAGHDEQYGAGFLVQAGRQASVSVAVDFNKDLGTFHVLASTSRLGMAFSPSKLNFAVQGTFTFMINGKKHVCRHFRVGQGNDGWNNNWWIGKSGCSGLSSPLGQLTCRTRNPFKKHCDVLFRATGEANHFEIRAL